MLKKSKKGFFGGFSGQKNIKNEYFDSVWVPAISTYVKNMV